MRTKQMASNLLRMTRQVKQGMQQTTMGKVTQKTQLTQIDDLKQKTQESYLEWKPFLSQ